MTVEYITDLSGQLNWGPGS